MKTDLFSLLVAGLTGAMMFAPTVAERRRTGLLRVIALAALTIGIALAAEVRVAYGLAAVVGVLHAVGAWRSSKAGAFGLVLAAIATMLAAVTVGSGAPASSVPNVAFIASFAAIALRAGVMPIHLGVAELCERAPREQVRQLASLAPLVLLHLRAPANLPLAHELAPALFFVGAVASLIAAIASLAQRDLRGFYRMTTMMHGGYVFCALAASGRGHDAAALFAALTLLLAVGGLGLIIAAVEERSGRIEFSQPGGRVAPFPHLAGAFAVLGAAGVGLPATAGFVADDLLLHAAWSESVVATAALILASVALAISTLRAYSRVFLGPAASSVAPDLLTRERLIVVAIIVALLILGVVPQFFIGALST